MKSFTIFIIFVLPIGLSGQSLTIKGKVTDSRGRPIVGVTVIEKGTTNGVITDLNGNYKITVSKSGALVISYMGYKTVELALGSKKIINISLQQKDSRLKEVVVKGFGSVVGRARRRAESVQKIPESVVTFTTKSIERKGITNLQSFADQVANVNFTSSQNVGNNFITVRGISQIRNGESPIALVIDGVTLPDPNLMNQELFDLALMEIVKGPQGALYGRNAIAGAINIVTNQPTNNFRGKVHIGYGNANNRKIQLTTAGPLVKNAFFYRISGFYKKSDGLLENISTKKKVDFVEDMSFRMQLKANFSKTATATLTGQYIDTKGGATYYASPIKGTRFSPDDFSNQAIQSDQLGESSLKSSYANLMISFNLPKFKLSSSTTYNKADRNHFGDLDFTSLDILRQFQDINTKTFNQEIRLSSKGKEKLSWDLGVFYQNTDKLLYTKATADFGFFASPASPTKKQQTLATSDFTNTISTIAAYGFAQYEVSDIFTISAGLRFDNDKISQDNRTLKSEDTKTVSQWQPKFSMSLKATKNTLLYINYGRGYRSGGFNQGKTIRFERDYKAETTNNYEFGVKNTLWNDRLIFNASSYYIGFSNQQLYALLIDGAKANILIGNFNVPRSESYGFEATLNCRASKYFDILMSYGLSKSRIIEGSSTISTGKNEKIDISGKNTPLIPQNSLSMAVESNFQLTEKIKFNANVHLKRTGKIFWHEDNRAFSSAYNLLNANVSLGFKKIILNIWGNNLLDKKYITEFADLTFSNSGKDLAWLGQPLTFGIGLSYRF